MPTPEKILWLYWENLPGKEEYPHIKLCRKIIRYQCSDIDVRLVTPENLEDYLPNMAPNLQRIILKQDGSICLPIKTAFIRAFLLEKYGGIYLDSDAIPLKSLKFVYDHISTHEFVAMRRTTAPSRHISIGFMGSLPQGKIISEYAKKLRDTLIISNQFSWGEVGAHSLTPIVNENLDRCYLFPEKQIHPVVAEKQYKFMSKNIRLNDVLSASTFIFMLYHKPFTGPSEAVLSQGIPANPNGWLNAWSQEQLYQSDLLISRVIRQAFPYEIAKSTLSLGSRHLITQTLSNWATRLQSFMDAND